MRKPYILTLLIICTTIFLAAFTVGQTAESGEALYEKHCQSCHMKKGKGFFRMYPPLTDTSWVAPDDQIVNNIISGLKGEITVNGKTYDNEMPPMAYLTDEEIAAIVNYVRNDINGLKASISLARVKELRGKAK